jgi:hypothetical protein
VKTERPGRGARELCLPDWPYGAVGRRLILEALLLDAEPREGWRKTALEHRVGTRPGGIDRHLAGAIDWGLARERRAGVWERPDPLPRIAEPLEALLRLTREAENRPILPLASRPYHRGA